MAGRPTARSTRSRRAYATHGPLPDSASIDAALAAAMGQDGHAIAARGDAGRLLDDGAVHADYSAGLAAHAAIETPAATARIEADRLELWVGTQAPAATRAAAARAIGFSEDAVTLYPMPLGGGFGAGFDTRPAEQAAILAQKVGRPVQLMWSRPEASVHDRFRPAARARLSAAVAPGGRYCGMARARRGAGSAARDGGGTPAGRPHRPWR